MKEFHGIIPPAVTPLNSERELDIPGLERLLEHMISGGVHGIFVLGTTGEGPALPASTRMEMAEATVDAVAGRGVVIDHVGAPNIWDAIALTEHATKIGVDCIASLAPTYSFKYNADELYEYYKCIASHTDKPVMVYATLAMDIPNFPVFMDRLMEIPNVIGVKCTLRNDFILHKIKEVNGGNINVINGPDETLICGLAMGADGGIGSTYNLMPGWFAKLFDAFKAGDLATAQQYQYKINRVIDAILRFGKFGAIRGVKAALEMKGYDVGHAVFPAPHYDKDTLAAYKKELESLGIEF